MPTEQELANNPEFDALKGLEGIDVDQLLGKEKGGDSGGSDDPANEGKSKEGPDADAGQGASGGTPPKDTDPPAPKPQDDILKEIFGDRFKTVDEAKSANITGQLEELEGLRRTKTELEEKLTVKPKTNFVDDEVALYNEFVRETGVKDYRVFSKINGADIANMDHMDALITRHLLQNPQQIGQEARVRRHFEKKYNVDPEQVDGEELEDNKIGMSSDGAQAVRELQEVKNKLTVPAPPAEPEKPKEMSPEEKASLQKGWDVVGGKVTESLSKLQVPIKGGKEPLLSYEISEDEMKEVKSFVADYAMQNQMELNEQNVKTIGLLVYNQLMINKLPDIVHSVFEKARNMTEAEARSFYENSSPSKNNDQPPQPPEKEKSVQEKEADDIFDAEMGQYGQ